MEILELVKKEYNNWQWLLDYPNLTKKLISYKSFFEYYGEIEIAKIDLSELDEEALNKYKLILSEDSFIISTSSKGRFIRSLDDEEIAIECLIAFTKGIDKEAEGILNAFFYKKGLKRDIISERKKYDNLVKELKETNTEHLANIEHTKSSLNTMLREGQQSVIDLKSACSNFVEESVKQKDLALDIREIKSKLESTLDIELKTKLEHASSAFEECIKGLHEQLEAEESSSSKRFDSFVDAYRNQMKLKAPVQYWQENVLHHKKSAKYFGIASLILSLLIFLPIAYVAWGILATETIIWGKVGVVAFTTSLAIWLIRILVRMYLSHNHMQMNSQERAVMTQAYLALISEGGASSDDERNLVLQAIFRPVSTGIITDDASPHNIIELINKTRK